MTGLRASRAEARGSSHTRCSRSHGGKGSEPSRDELIYVLRRLPGCSIKSGGEVARAEPGDEPWLSDDGR